MGHGAHLSGGDRGHPGDYRRGPVAPDLDPRRAGGSEPDSYAHHRAHERLLEFFGSLEPSQPWHDLEDLIGSAAAGRAFEDVVEPG
jgi:hypothetical protein